MLDRNKKGSTTMKNKTRRITLLTILATIGFNALCDAKTAPLETLNTPHSLRIMATGLDLILKTEPIWKPLQIDVDPDVLSKLKKDKTKCTISIKDVEVKYVLAWMIHFAGANATVREDGSIYITTSDKLSEGDQVFECYKEINGKWAIELEKELRGKTHGQNLKDAPVSMYVQSLNDIYGIPVIIDPMLLVGGELRKKITTSVETDCSCGKALASVLKQVGLTYKLQGGVVFITK